MEAGAGTGLAYRPSLDGFRGIAILLVIFYHLRVLPGGSLGVDMFFVLSGLLITSILLKEWELTGSIRLGRFYARRFLRLGPALVAFVLSVYFVTHVLQPSLAGMLQGRWAVAALSYTTNLLIAYGREYPLGAVSIHWSLALEEQFYLLWPLCFRFLLQRRVPVKHIAGLLLVASFTPALWRAVLVNRDAADPDLWLRLYFAPDTRADPLLVGCALALLLARRQGLAGAGAAAAAGAAVLGVLAATVQGLPFYPWLFLLTAFASAGVLLWAWSGGPWTRLLEFAPLVWIGRLSYSLYLWHNTGLGIGSTLPMPAQLGVALLAAAASYYLVELPFLRLKTRFASNGRRLSQPPAPRAWTLAMQPAAGLLALTAIVGFGYALHTRRIEASPASRARERLSLAADDPDRLAELAEGLIEGASFEIAVDALGRAVALRPGDARMLASYGLALRGAGRRAEASLRLQEALRLDPREPRAHFGLGELALDGDRLMDAIESYSRSLEAAPANAATHNALGIAYALRGDHENAIRHFSEAARIDPTPSILANLERARASAAR